MTYPGNSESGKAPKASSPPKKTVQKVTSGSVKRRKKPLAKRLADVFFGGDANSALASVVQDVLIPAAKDTVVDAVIEGAQRTVYGASGRGGRSYNRYGGPNQPNTNYSYSSLSANPQQRRPGADPRGNSLSQRARSTHDFDEIILENRMEADKVLDGLFTLLNEFGQTTVTDLYNLLGVTPGYTDDNYGWRSLEGVGTSRARGGGWILNLPKPELLTN